MVYIFVGLGGVIGSLLRYFLSVLSQSVWGNDIPLGTLIINLTGSFILGWITSKWVRPKTLHPDLLTGLTTGIIGSYTTFSTFCVDVLHLLQGEKYTFALMYFFISSLGGLFFVRIGLALGEQKKAGSVS